MSATSQGLLKAGVSLTEVEVRVDNLTIPPQYRHPSDQTFTDAPTLQRVADSMTRRGLSRGTTTQTPGCTGGSTWTILLTGSDGSRVEIDAYLCGSGAQANVSGDVVGFVGDLQALP